MSSPEAITVVVEMRKLWPNGWHAIDDEIVATALDKFAAERARNSDIVVMTIPTLKCDCGDAGVCKPGCPRYEQKMFHKITAST